MPFFLSNPWSLTTSTIIVVSDGKASRAIFTLIGSWPVAGGASTMAAHATANTLHIHTARVFIALAPSHVEARPGLPGTRPSIRGLGGPSRPPCQSRRINDSLVGQLVEVLGGHRALEH